ncbi:DUF192 domain-containing protein [Desulfonatronum thiodismutans]|uniref:DUF192 domain-containing protein n=1 Tax=Desulfonatronum thiodismutans TaxID=159290 RepID=UPI000A00008E|nr:DUF192 domain-containing protein [Desulfonatronum thiodismutans]
MGWSVFFSRLSTSTYSCFNTANGTQLASRLEKADRLAARVKGLLGRRGLESGHGLWIEPCKQIHTFFMRFPIDVVFIDSRHHVLSMRSGFLPWRLSPFLFSARSVLELPTGMLEGRVRVGDRLHFFLNKVEKHAA